MLKGLPTVKFIADDKEGGGNARAWTLWFNQLASLLKGWDTNEYGVVLPAGVLITGLPGRNYANDAAAGIGGVPIGGLYHNAGAVRVRLV